MIKNERLVFDTNVLISAVLLAQSKPAKLFLWAVQHSIILVSLATLHELRDVLHRKKFNKYIAPEDRDQFLLHYTKLATLVEINSIVEVCRDPRDNMFLDVAINGHATKIITGDPDLLVLHPFQNIEIITPNDFFITITSLNDNDLAKNDS